MTTQTKTTQQKVKIIKDLRLALKDLKLFVENPKNLWNGRKIKNFNLLPREAWANWLICATLRKMYKADITFADDNKGDGFILDRSRKLSFPTEHVSALDIPKGKTLPRGEQRVIDAINLKISKGSEYAWNKILVVFFDGAGEYFRSKIRESIFGKHNFEAVFCVGLLNSGKEGYSYYVTEFKDSFGNRSITHRVEINRDFTDWKISQIKK